MATPATQVESAERQIVELPQDLFYVGQLKYELDPLPKWKVWIFYHICLPFARFCHLRLGLPTISHLKDDGTPGWIEDQSVCTTRERARELKNGRPFWFIQPLPLDKSLPEETCEYGEYEFPNSPAKYSGRDLDVMGIRRGDWNRIVKAAERISDASDTRPVM